MQVLRPIWFSFPVQLLVLHCRRHLFLLVSFSVLVLMVLKFLAARYGFAYLFLDPEYAGHVNALSFYMLGLAYGMFTVLWNITSYILFSHKFPFLATFRRPFFRYCLNNFVIPAAFGVIYLVAMVRFQRHSEFKSVVQILEYAFGWLLGASTGFLVTLSRSLNTHRKDYDEMEQEEARRQHRRHRTMTQAWRFHGDDETAYRHPQVDYALMYPWKVRRVRKVDHYRRSILIAVFRQHQKNALILELIALELVVLMGFMMDYQKFRLPTGVSFFLMFSILLAPIGAFSYWLKAWATTAFIGLFLVYNVFVKFNLVGFQNRAFGWHYEQPLKPYNLQTIADASNPHNVTFDSLRTVQILNRWKAKQDAMFPQEKKHKMVFVNASGGGLRSAMWAFYMMQRIDSVSGKTFLDRAQMICGASGGTLGQAYFRELYRRRKADPTLNLQSPQYITNVSKDLLNAVSFALVVNDLFLPWQHFSVGNESYPKDRGYLWEKQLNENTGGVMDKPMGAYADDEENARLPLMIFTPTVTDDARRMCLSNFPMAYLDRPDVDTLHYPLRYDGIDACNFFGTDEARNLRYTTAIRMNATFPYIMPNTYLPTIPEVNVMDAGLRDNYGVETTLRFVYTFRKWINQNTAGIVLVQTLGFAKNTPPEIDPNPSFVQRRMDPLFSIYYNWMDYQDFHNDVLMSSLGGWVGVDADVVNFEYIPEELNSPTSMSWHLTEREKHDIAHACLSPYNRWQMTRLKKVMGFE